MISFVTWITRRVIRSRSEKSRWVRRAVLLVAAVKWINRRTGGSRVVHLRKNEYVEVIVVPKETVVQ